MKRLFLAVMLLLGGFSLNVFAKKADIPMQIFDDSVVGDFGTKGPNYSFVIHQDDNILTMTPSSVDLVLQLRDSLGNVVYSIYLPSGTSQVVLPSTLTGTFELRLLASTYYYLGYITL